MTRSQTPGPACRTSSAVVFYFIGESISDWPVLQEAACRLGLSCFDEVVALRPVLVSGHAAGTCSRGPRSRKPRASMKILSFDFDSPARWKFRHFHDGESNSTSHLGEFLRMQTCAARQPPTSTSPQGEHRRFNRTPHRAHGPHWLGCASHDRWERRPIAFHVGLCYLLQIFVCLSHFPRWNSRAWPRRVLRRQCALGAIMNVAKCFF